MSAKNRILVNIEKNIVNFKIFNDNYISDSFKVDKSKNYALYNFKIRKKYENELKVNINNFYYVENIISFVYITKLSWIVNFTIDIIRIYYYFKNISLKNKIFLIKVGKTKAFYFIELYENESTFSNEKGTIIEIKFDQNEVPSYGP